MNPIVSQNLYRTPRRHRALTGFLGIVALGLPLLIPVPALAQKPAEKPQAQQEDSEIKMGRETHEEMIKSGLKLVTDPKTLARVEAIGKKVAEIANKVPLPAGYGSDKFVPYEYRFFVVDDPDINAFSLPGGYIYVNRGLLNYIQSDDELAGVIGHEIAHASHHHVVRLQKEQNRFNNQLAIGLLAAILAKVPAGDTANLYTGFQLVALQKVNGFGQEAERDADRTGLIYAQKAGYDPVGALTFMERLARDQRSRPNIDYGIFRTHPPEKERVQNLTKQLEADGIKINRRRVTNMLKVQVRTASVTVTAEKTGTPVVAADTASEVLLDNQILFRTASAERAKTVAATLDRILDTELQLYDITKRGPSLMAKGEVIFTVENEDLPAQGKPSTLDAVVDNGYKTLRNALFKQFLENSY